MSNRVCIQRCEFVDYHNHNVTYGFRAYDGYDQMYMNTASRDELAVEPLAFLKWMKENVNDDCLGQLFSFVEENETGLNIDDSWYEWNEIRHIFSDEHQEETHIEAGTSQSPRRREGA